ncbi:MAG: hypothetical protein MZV49_04405 [Rhodopseudomonas palustris]|nr:hypothetical protein [Rhodopseudomonas palustris]
MPSADAAGLDRGPRAIRRRRRRGRARSRAQVRPVDELIRFVLAPGRRGGARPRRASCPGRGVLGRRRRATVDRAVPPRRVFAQAFKAQVKVSARSRRPGRGAARCSGAGRCAGDWRGKAGSGGRPASPRSRRRWPTARRWR